MHKCFNQEFDFQNIPVKSVRISGIQFRFLKPPSGRSLLGYYKYFQILNLPDPLNFVSGSLYKSNYIPCLTRTQTVNT